MTRLEKAEERVRTAKDKFEARDLDSELRSFAQVYLNGLDLAAIKMDWLKDVATRFQKTGVLSDAQTKGVLNCARASLARAKQKNGSGGSAPIRKPEAAGANLPDGTYTVVFEEGNHRTLKIATAPESSKLAGKRIISYLSGSDNADWRSYTGFGFINDTDDGDECSFFIWSKFRIGKGLLTEAVEVLLGDPKAAAKAYGMESGRCCVCGRLLTVPESIEAGIGPVCAVKFG